MAWQTWWIIFLDLAILQILLEAAPLLTDETTKPEQTFIQRDLSIKPLIKDGKHSGETTLVVWESLTLTLIIIDMGAACYARMSPVPVSAAIGHWLWVAGPMLTGAQWTSHSAALIGQNIRTSHRVSREERHERGGLCLGGLSLVESVAIILRSPISGSAHKYSLLV